MRMTASWFRSLDLPHTRLWRDSTAPESGLPSDCHPDCSARSRQDEAWRDRTKNSLAQWYRARTENARGARKPMIVALARKLLIALWRFVWQSVVPDGVVLRPAQ